jgi:hypothetical protein
LCLTGGRRAGVVAGLGAEFGELVAVCVGLVFGALGTGAQVGTQLVAVTGSIGAEAGQHRVCVGTDPAADLRRLARGQRLSRELRVGPRTTSPAGRKWSAAHG